MAASRTVTASRVLRADLVGDRVADRRQRGDPGVDQLVALVELEPRLRHRARRGAEGGARGRACLEATSYAGGTPPGTADRGEAGGHPQRPARHVRAAARGRVIRVVGEGVVAVGQPARAATRVVVGPLRGVRVGVAGDTGDHAVRPRAVAERRAHPVELHVVARRVEATEGPAVVVAAELAAVDRHPEDEQRLPAAAGEAPAVALPAGRDERVVEIAGAWGVPPGDDLDGHPPVVERLTRGTGHDPVVEDVGLVEDDPAVADVDRRGGRRGQPPRGASGEDGHCRCVLHRASYAPAHRHCHSPVSGPRSATCRVDSSRRPPPSNQPPRPGRGGSPVRSRSARSRPSPARRRRATARTRRRPAPRQRSRPAR